eukprot:3027040-Pleurochrysis_carterae.AAC.3
MAAVSLPPPAALPDLVMQRTPPSLQSEQQQLCCSSWAQPFSDAPCENALKTSARSYVAYQLIVLAFFTQLRLANCDPDSQCPLSRPPPPPLPPPLRCGRRRSRRRRVARPARCGSK